MKKIVYINVIKKFKSMKHAFNVGDKVILGALSYSKNRVYAMSGIVEDITWKKEINDFVYVVKAEDGNT